MNKSMCIIDYCRISGNGRSWTTPSLDILSSRASAVTSADRMFTHYTYHTIISTLLYDDNYSMGIISHPGSTLKFTLNTKQKYLFSSFPLFLFHTHSLLHTRTHICFQIWAWFGSDTDSKEETPEHAWEEGKKARPYYLQKITISPTFTRR